MAPPVSSHWLWRLPMLQGWRRNALLFAAGALGAAAFPPIGAFPLLVLGLAALLLLLDGATTLRRAWADGWWFSYGLSVAGMYWIAISLTVDAARFGWMIPFAVFGLTAVLAVYGGVATALCWRIPATGLRRVVVFAVCWLAGEALRGTVPYGFPWNLTGSAWGSWDITLQAASLIGVYGLSVWTAFAAGLLVWPYLRRPLRGAWDCPPRALWGVVACAFVLALPLGYGAARLVMAPDVRTPLRNQPTVQLRLVQPAIAQTMKWDPRFARETVLTQLRLSRLMGQKETDHTHTIWPEAALSFRLAETPPLVADMAAAAPENGAIITGTTRLLRSATQAPQFFNSIEAVDAKGHVASVYDKIELVPFGEFVPLRQWLPIDKITPGAYDFSRGQATGPVQIAGLPPAAPLICYEIIFPDFVRNQTRDTGAGQAQWLLNITNDAWFGASSGPYQHFAAARLRAAELGLPVIRVANDGITAVVDGYGRVLDALPRGAMGVLDTALPKPIPTPTLVARYGYLPVLLMVALLLALAGASFRRA